MARTPTAPAMFRRRISADCLDKARGKVFTFILPADADGRPLVLNVKAGATLAFSLRTRSRPLVIARQAAALEQFEVHMASLRGGPVVLAPRHRTALAGVIYRDWASALASDAVLTPEQWQKVAASVRADSAGTATLAISTPEVVDTLLEMRFGGMVDIYLSREHLRLTVESRMALLRDVARAMAEFAERLARQADGDYSPDANETRFPAWESKKADVATQAKPSGRLTFATLFKRWQDETNPAPSTVSSWRGYIDRFAEFVGHDNPATVTAADITRWKDKKVAEGTAPNGTYLAALQALYNYAVSNQALTGITQNPAEGVKDRGASRRRRARREPYRTEQVRHILALCDKEANPVRRWVPWLLALTGARIGEITQLWGSRIKLVDGMHVIELAPAEDGGRLKTEGSHRTIPLSQGLIERGFLDFVKRRGDGPLFYDPSRRSAARARRDGGAKHKSKGVSNRISEWIREANIGNANQPPAHAFRHWFKTECLRLGVAESVADAIQGHVGRVTAASGYRHVDLAMMADAVSRVTVVAAESQRIM